MKKNILDAKEQILKNDPGHMLSCIEELPDQVKDCWEDVKKFTVPAHFINAKNIVILGMGGSAIGGDLFRTLVTNFAKVPIHIIRDYDLPAFVDKGSLVIASSYSGNTEETVTAFAQASEQGAKLMGITGGGNIEKLCKKYNAPYFKVNYESQPRAALGYSLTSIMGILGKLGVIDLNDEDVEKALKEMYDLAKKIDINAPEVNNPAKELAVRMKDKFVLVVGSGTLTEVAHRYKTQINENSKQAAFWDVLPELNHNTIVGLEYPKNLSDNMFVLILQSAYDHPRTKLRQRILIDILGKKKINYETIMFAPSASPLSEMLKMILFGDYVTYYLSVLNNVDPTPVEMIAYLKDKLAKQK